jgi:hypothetical protein
LCLAVVNFNVKYVFIKNYELCFDGFAKEGKMDIIKNLEKLNAKERYYLITFATDNKTIRLGCEFRKKLGKTIYGENENGEPVRLIPEDSFVAIDFHLNWLYAALYYDVLTDDGTEKEVIPDVIKSDQQDIDLLIAYMENGKTMIIMVEAKGTGSWGNGQLNSKIDRLNKIFKQSEKNIIPKLVLLSPNEPQRLDIAKSEEGRDRWQNWLNKNDNKPFWVQLEIPKLKKVGKLAQNSKKWKISDR